MGNSNSSANNHTRSHQPYHPAFHREIRPNGHLHYPNGPPPPHGQPHPFNPDYKVLPERIPGRKLRMTDNGAILLSGGTISGKPGMQPPPRDDLEFLRVLNRRPDGEEDRRSFSSNSRHYSTPDLLQPVSPYDIHGYETDGGSSRRRFHKKTKAPPPPTQLNDSMVNRANSFRDPLTGTVMKINPWEQRRENKCVSVPTKMRSMPSTDKILERREGSRHDLRSNSRQDWRFRQRPDQMSGPNFTDLPGKNPYVGSMNRQRSAEDKLYRAKSMDSLQLSVDSARPVNNKIRQSVDNLDKPISFEQRTKLERHRRMQNSQENLRSIEKVEEMKRPSSRQSSVSTSSLSRPHLSSRIASPREANILPRERSSASCGQVTSPISKTEIMLTRKDSNSTPKQYYFGDEMKGQRPQPPIPAESDSWLCRTNSSHKLEVKSTSNSHHSGGGHSMLSQPEIPVKKSGTPPQRPESRNSRNGDVTSSGVTAREGQAYDSTFHRQMPQGRQRNSYAFEGTRYRYELGGCETINKPLVQLSLDNPDDDDINMQLRPTLPKRVPALPRFSPTQAWRSLNLEHIITNAHVGADVIVDGGGGDVHEDSIRRVTRPVAPPRTANERSADSGISQDAGSPGLATDFDLGPIEKPRRQVESPVLDVRNPEEDALPVEHKRKAWTPEEDLASDFDGGSNEHPVVVDGQPRMISVQPKLMSMKNMFSSNEEAGGVKKLWSKPADVNSPHTFNSVRKLKRSSSGAMASGEDGIGENWSFSHSLPTSLHNGHEGDKDINEKKDEATTPNYRMRRVGSGPICHSPIVAGLQSRVMSLDSLHPNTQRMWKSGNTDKLTTYSPSQHIIYLPEYDAKKIVLQNDSARKEFENVIYVGCEPKKSKKFTFQSTVRQHERRKLEQKLSQVAEQDEKMREREKLLVDRVEEEFQRKRAREKASICDQLKILSGSSTTDVRETESGIVGSQTPPPPLMSATQIYFYHGDERNQSNNSANGIHVTSSPHYKLEKQDSGFFSGISKWMRRQQKLEEQQKTSRQEPDGAPAVTNQIDGGVNEKKVNDQRDYIISSSKYSRGELFNQSKNHSKTYLKLNSDEMSLYPNSCRVSRGQPLCPRSSIEDSDRSSEMEDAEPKRHSRYRSPDSGRKQNGHSQEWNVQDVLEQSSEKKLSR